MMKNYFEQQCNEKNSTVNCGILAFLHGVF
jgi:hypothetical protein